MSYRYDGGQNQYPWSQVTIGPSKHDGNELGVINLFRISMLRIPLESKFKHGMLFAFGYSTDSRVT